MNIALCHYRVGETDGVSLEMDKWKKVLERMGHKVYMLAGSEGTADAYIIEEMHIRLPEDLKIERNAYVKLKDYKTEEELKDAVEALSKKIEDKLIKFIKDYKIDVLVPNNIFSLGRGLSTAIAFKRAIEKTGVKCVNHHHDFYWERELYSHPVCKYVEGLLNEYFPPKIENMKHAVINTPAQNDLKEKKGLDSTVVPNVFDFNAPLWKEDEYNKDFRQAVGLKENEIFMLQATRVVDRKAIELAIDLIAELNKPKNKEKMIGKTLYDGRVFKEDSEYVLVMVGLHEGSEGYVEKLKEHANKKGVKVIIRPDLVDHSRHIKDGKKVYSLWDAYVKADIITYPSIYEGWGNQFLEGLFAKKPMVVFEYSVFLADIKDKGFNYISLGDKYETLENGLVKVSDDILEKAAAETIKYLTDKDFREKAVHENFELGKEHYSLEALEKILRTLF